MKQRFLTTVRSKKFIKGVVISIILITTPYLFYLYREVPKADVWETAYFTINKGGFGSVRIFVYHLMIKLISALSFSLWFFTCRHWWRFALLVPFTMFLFQLSGILNQQMEYFDEYDFYYSLPITLPVIVLHILIALKFNNKVDKLTLNELVEAEIESALNEELE